MTAVILEFPRRPLLVVVPYVTLAVVHLSPGRWAIESRGSFGSLINHQETFETAAEAYERALDYAVIRRCGLAAMPVDN